MSYHNKDHYSAIEWLTLRDEILVRDGQCWRNCGTADQLEVHHWLPLPSFRNQVDDRGYGSHTNPLIVHESGLITLCAACHHALTEQRTKQAVLKNPEILKSAKPDRANQNIFELWALNNKELPFRVRKETWNTEIDQYYLVEKVEITKWPYGKAWGCYVRDGVSKDANKIPNSGTYTWIKV